MNVFLVSWYTPILLEAYKFWFYAICTAIARTSSDLLLRLAAPSTQNDSVSEKEKDETSNHSKISGPVPSTASLVKSLIIDSLDLIIPGSLLGWIPVADLGVALAMLASTILVWPAAWAKAQL
jgi:hypothetical protein